MHKTFLCIIATAIFSSALVHADYNGPYLLWGLSGLNGVKNSAISTLDDTLLRDFYAKASSIIVFLKNGSTRLDETNFPKFKGLVNENEYIYLTQDQLTSDPLDYNANAEVINLVGDGAQQDVELTALYKDAVMNYGEGKVLGIVASRFDIALDRRSKRAADEPTTADTPVNTKNIYIAKANRKNVEVIVAIMWTSEPPVLRVQNISYVLDYQTGVATVDKSNDKYRFKVNFRNNVSVRDKISLMFFFVRSYGGWWNMKYVDVVDEAENKNFTLNIVGAEPSAPMNYSYHCPGRHLFKSRTHDVTLTMNSIQVQPYETNGKFGIAYDCVGFFTVPIWAGIFVTFILLLLLTIALTAIAEIKPPTRFESKSGAQLTFTVQE